MAEGGLRRGSCLIAWWWYWRRGGYLVMHPTRWNLIPWIAWPHFLWLPPDSPGRQYLEHFAPPDHEAHKSPPLVFRGRHYRGD